jgi:hypothetical protein
MRTAIEQARIDLAKWEARVAEDTEALMTAERQAAIIRDRLNASKRTAVNLRYAVQQWDKWHAGAQPPNTEAQGRR